MLDIVIVNWNTGSRLRACLKSIAIANIQKLHIFVVDNASTDDSLKNITIDIPMDILQNDHNRGFAAACNQGARLGSAKYILFLNPDTLLFNDSLCKPLDYMESENNNRVGILSVQLLDETGQVSRSCSRFPRPVTFLAQASGISKIIGRRIFGDFMLDWDHGDTRQVDQVMGAYFLVRRDLYQSLSGFDERFFVYYEEVDFSIRANNLGWKSMYYSDARVFHEGGGSSSQVKPHRLFYSLRSRILYAFKHFRRSQAWVVTAFTLLVEPFPRLLRALIRLSPSEARDTLSGFVMLWQDSPNFIRRGLHD